MLAESRYRRGAAAGSPTSKPQQSDPQETSSAAGFHFIAHAFQVQIRQGILLACVSNYRESQHCPNIQLSKFITRLAHREPPTSTTSFIPPTNHRAPIIYRQWHWRHFFKHALHVVMLMIRWVAAHCVHVAAMRAARRTARSRVSLRRAGTRSPGKSIKGWEMPFQNSIPDLYLATSPLQY
jgi:hypothetical protein